MLIYILDNSDHVLKIYVPFLLPNLDDIAKKQRSRSKLISWTENYTKSPRQDI